MAMKDEWKKLRESAISEEELEGVVGGAQAVETVRCAGCGRGGVAAAMYTLGNKRYCSACYREALKG